MSLSPCSCCGEFPWELVYIGAVVATASVVRAVFFSNSKSKFIRFIDSLLKCSMAFFILVSAIIVSNPSVQQFLFSRLCMKLVQSSQMDPIRCGLVRNVKGKILELGPGPGTNFRCWENSTFVTEWTGVEPNGYFNASLTEEKTKRNILFPTNVVWLSGEDLDVEPASFDAVIGTHVLCSVSDVSAVLRQVHRALKPGGTYYFMEHVAAQEQEEALRRVQRWLAPILKVIANGCAFKTLWRDIATLESNGFDVALEHISAPSLSFMVPHIAGTAVKK